MVMRLGVWGLVFEVKMATSSLVPGVLTGLLQRNLNEVTIRWVSSKLFTSSIPTLKPP